jgi:hypothetical protein
MDFKRNPPQSRLLERHTLTKEQVQKKGKPFDQAFSKSFLREV